MYFAKLTSQWTPNNSLLKYLNKVVQICEKRDVDDVITMENYLQKQIALANQTYRKCRPVKLSRRGGTADLIYLTDDITLTVEGVCEIRLYKKEGTFKEAGVTEVYVLFDASQIA